MCIIALATAPIKEGALYLQDNEQYHDITPLNTGTYNYPRFRGFFAEVSGRHAPSDIPASRVTFGSQVIGLPRVEGEWRFDESVANCARIMIGRLNPRFNILLPNP